MKSTFILPAILALLLLTCLLFAPHWLRHTSGDEGRAAPAIRSNAVALPAATRHILGRSSSHVSGTVITTHWTQQKTMALNYVGSRGDLMRYDIRDGLVAAKKCIYHGGDAGVACLNGAGDHVAFIKGRNTLAVIGTDGKGEIDLPGLGQPLQFLQWPGGDGGEWIDFIAHDERTLRRVNWRTRVVQVVARFNRAVDHFGLSADAGLRNGVCVARAETEAAVYYLKDANGDLFRLLTPRACGISVSPDGRSFSANTVEHEQVRIMGMDGSVKKTFRVNQWVKGGSDGCDKWQHQRWGVNSPDWLVIPQSRSIGGREDRIALTNTVLYNWAEGKQVQVTDNSPGEFDLAQGFWLRGVPTAGFQLGECEDKAPFKVEFKPGGRGGIWNWSYGDGSTDRGLVGLHTYRLPGSYQVAAWTGNQVLWGHVLVHERTRPRATAATMLDNRHILISFNEPVRLRAPRISLAGGGSIQRWTLDSSNQRMVVTTERTIRRDEELHLIGMTDRAQAANLLQGERLKVKFLPWPLRRAGLSFLWQNANTPNAFYGDITHPVVENSLVQHGLATFNQDGAMSLQGGSFGTAPTSFLSQQGSRGEFALEATVQAAEPDQGNANRPATIIDVSSADGRHGFRVAQEGKRLLLLPRTSRPSGVLGKDALNLGSIGDEAPHHVIISRSRGELTCYLDGRRVSVAAFHRSWTGPLARTNLRFAGGPDDGEPWRGSLEGVALYHRFLGSQEVRQEWDASKKFFRKRPAVAPLYVDAQLIAVSKAPTPEEVAPYRDALIVCEYEVRRVLKGTYSQKRIRVTRWGLLDNQPTEAAHAQPGSIIRLELDLLKDRPELQDKFTSDTLADNFDLTPYTDAGTR